MKFAELLDPDILRIDAYSRDSIQVGGRQFFGSILLLPDAGVQPWSLTSAEDLTADHLESLFQSHPQLILIGTGHNHQLPNPVLLECAARRGLGIEWMQTGAACRTYNLLVSEGRRVAAGLIIPAC